MEFEFVVEMNLVQIGTNEFFPQLIRLAANERQLQSRPCSNQKLGDAIKVQRLLTMRAATLQFWGKECLS